MCMPKWINSLPVPKIAIIQIHTINKHTVWKSTLKCCHGEKNSVKSHNKNLQNLLLQMDDFLPLAGISGLFTYNEFCSQEFILEFIVKNFFSINGTLLEILLPKN